MQPCKAPLSSVSGGYGISLWRDGKVESCRIPVEQLPLLGQIPSKETNVSSRGKAMARAGGGEGCDREAKTLEGG